MATLHVICHLVQLEKKPADFGYFNSILLERISCNKLKLAKRRQAKEISVQFVASEYSYCFGKEKQLNIDRLFHTLESNQLSSHSLIRTTGTCFKFSKARLLYLWRAYGHVQVLGFSA